MTPTLEEPSCRSLTAIDMAAAERAKSDRSVAMSINEIGKAINKFGIKQQQSTPTIKHLGRPKAEHD